MAGRNGVNEWFRAHWDGIAYWGAVAVLTAAILWPGIPIAAEAAVGGYETTADTALATIVAALLVLVPTAAALATQALSPLSWRAARVVAGTSSLIGAAVAAVVGVAVPMLASVNPGAWTTRVAFAGFLVATALITASTWRYTRNATPDWLTSHIAEKTLIRPMRRRSSTEELHRYTAVLADLIGTAPSR